MSFLGNRGSSKDQILRRFTKYLNGPMGKTVLESLEDGESFILHTSDHAFRVTKKNGKAVVEFLELQVA
ncbi:MAG: hypothetical protein PVJ05_01975 [Candidatus Thorarchaeota archaeon]|jgi:hypothetical protein